MTAEERDRINRAKHFLERGRFADLQLKHYGERLRQLKENAAADESCHELPEIRSCREDIGKKTVELLRIQNEIEAAIDELDDPGEQVVLRMRYLTYMKWEDIAEELGYEMRQIYRIRNRACLSIKFQNMS